MANEVTIVVKGTDRTGGLFSGVAARANSSFAKVRQSINGHMQAAVGDAASAGQAISARLEDGAESAASKVRAALSGAFRDAEGDADTSGRSIGDRLSSGLRAGVMAGTDAVRGLLSGHWGDLGGDADRDGRGIGSKLMSSVGAGLKTAAGAVTDGLSSAFKMASSAAGPVLTAALVVVAAGAAVAMSAAIAGALVMGLGAGFVGIGAMLLMQNEKVKAQFAKTGNEIKAIMTDAAKPLLPVFTTAMNSVKSLVKEFNPIFAGVFKDAKGPLQDFVKGFVGAFKELKPAVAPIMSAFTGLLDVIGPSLKGTFKDIGSALKDMANVVLENKTVIGGMFIGLLKAVPLVINGISFLVGLFSNMVGVLNGLMPVATGVFNNISQAVLTFAENFLGTLRSIGVALGNVPGMESFSKKMVAGLDTAIAKVGEWKAKSAELNRQVELRANINDLTMKLDKAKAALADPNLTKERRAQLTADITRLEVAKAKAVADLGDPKLVKEYRATLNANIETLQSRIATARKELADPNLTKERKAKLNADIASLQGQVSAAKAAINSIQGKTVYINTVYRSSNGTVKASTLAHGGVVPGGIGVRKFANGGLSGAGSSLAMVGEQGPELVRLPFGSSVVPAGQTRSMVGGSAGPAKVVLEIVSGGSRLDDVLVEILRNAVRVRGGDVQQVFGR